MDFCPLKAEVSHESWIPIDALMGGLVTIQARVYKWGPFCKLNCSHAKE